MASANITKEQFADFVMSFLLDKMLHQKDILPGHEEFQELVRKMETKGMRPLLMYYYMGMDTNVRSKYKMVGKTFKGGNKESFMINAKGEVPQKAQDTSNIKGLIKKALKLVVSHKKRSGFPLSEEKVDKILDKLLESEGVIVEYKESE